MNELFLASKRVYYKFSDGTIFVEGEWAEIMSVTVVLEPYHTASFASVTVHAL